jgi:DNA-binding NarL/FixJ family response regulator
MENNQVLSNSYIYLCSRNPVAVWAINNLLATSVLNSRVDVLFPQPPFIVPQGVHILLIDASSISEWPETVTRWTSAGHRAVLLVGGSRDLGNAELRALHLGVRGVVEISHDFTQRLSEAISVVAKGQLFASNQTLESFYCGSRRVQPGPATPHLSFREQQVVDLLVKGLSNRKIGTVLGISERTAKFHVCNILHKLQVRTRKELFDQHENLLEQYRSA